MNGDFQKMMCGKCSKISGWIFLALGLAYLLVDFNVWTFFGIQWWSALFFFGGISVLASGSCSNCEECRMPSKGMKK